MGLSRLLHYPQPYRPLIWTKSGCISSSITSPLTPGPADAHLETLRRLFMRRFGEDATLRSAVASVGLAALSNVRKDEAILRGARQRYGQAIRVIRNALKSHTADQLDGTMKMILMVALFEVGSYPSPWRG